MVVLFKEENKMRIAYNLKDLTQAAIGAFISIVVFLAIRGNNPFFFN